jgi:hypothetical protein
MQKPWPCVPDWGRGEYCVDWQTHVADPVHAEAPESDWQLASSAHGVPSE